MNAHERRKVMEVTVLPTVTLSWSPDSAAFIANDRAFSDVENAYIYDVKTLERIDLRRQILAADGTAASRFTSDANPAANHSYFHALRWLDARHVEMQLYGHTDGTPNGKPFRGSVLITRDRLIRRNYPDHPAHRLSHDSAPTGSHAGLEGLVSLTSLTVRSG